MRALGCLAPRHEEATTQPAVYGPYRYLPITQRKKFSWPDQTRLALSVIPNIEFFHLDDPLPGVNNERLSAAQVKIPNVRNWALRDLWAYDTTYAVRNNVTYRPFNYTTWPMS